MAKKPSNATTEWLNRYSFWRGQYQVRNPRYIALDNELAQIDDIFKQFDSRTVGFEDQYAIYDLWGEDILLSSDPIESYEYLPAELKNHAIKSRELLKIICNDYRYTSELIDSLDIYYSIYNKKFPPQTNFEGDILDCCGDYIRTAHVPFCFDENNKNILRFEVDCTESTSEVLDTIRFQMDRYKKFLADPKSYPFSDTTTPRRDEILMERMKREIKEKSKANFRASDSQRAIGLMIRDWVAISPDESPADAIRSVQGFIADRIGWKDTPSITDNWRSYYENAQDCIESGEVLEILRK